MTALDIQERATEKDTARDVPVFNDPSSLTQQEGGETPQQLKPRKKKSKKKNGLQKKDRRENNQAVSNACPESNDKKITTAGQKQPVQEADQSIGGAKGSTLNEGQVLHIAPVCTVFSQDPQIVEFPCPNCVLFESLEELQAANLTPNVEGRNYPYCI